MGADGDGVGALADGTPIYVPLTLPGELLDARPVAPRGDGWAAVADDLLAPSVDRVEPPCPHFGACGGCSLQHWRDGSYVAWKAALLRDALRRAGFDGFDVAEIVQTPPRTRRRLDLAARRVTAGVVLGLHRPRSKEVVDLADCHVLDPALTALIAPARTLLARLQGLRREASVVANLLDNGPDLLLRTDAALTLADRTGLTAFARAHGVSRVAWALGDDTPEPVCVLRPPAVTLSGVPVSPPPGAFLQASVAGEAAIVATVLAALPAKLPARAWIAELFAGCGAFSFALAERVRVAAWEGDAAAVKALRTAANQAGLPGRLTATQRDLARQPLAAPELAGCAAVVLDPPFAGAPAQMPALAAAKPAVVVYVSCSPAALARDARVLRDAGYRVASATPIDQFLWSARLESVVAFVRE
jgi:23S rRNA (uracil1939-C5)-methyltransferase